MSTHGAGSHLPQRRSIASVSIRQLSPQRFSPPHPRPAPPFQARPQLYRSPSLQFRSHHQSRQRYIHSHPDVQPFHPGQQQVPPSPPSYPPPPYQSSPPPQPLLQACNPERQPRPQPRLSAEQPRVLYHSAPHGPPPHLHQPRPKYQPQTPPLPPAHLFQPDRARPPQQPPLSQPPSQPHAERQQAQLHSVQADPAQVDHPSQCQPEPMSANQRDSAPLSPPPRTVSTSTMTLPPGAQPATIARPAVVRTPAPPPSTSAYGPPRQASPPIYDRFARQASPQPYDRSAAFGARPASPQTYDRAALAPARYNLAAAFGPSKSAQGRPARYSPAAAFGPPRSDSGHSSESGRGPAPYSPAPSPTPPPARLPPGAGVLAQPQPQTRAHNDAAQPQSWKPHQFGEEAGPIPIPPRPRQTSSVYATPMSTPPIAGKLADGSTPPPRPQRSPSRGGAKKVASTGLPSPPESPPKQANPKPEDSFVVKRHTRRAAQAPASPSPAVRPPPAETPIAHQTAASLAKGTQAEELTPPKRGTETPRSSSGSFAVLRGTRNPASPQATPPSLLPRRPADGPSRPPAKQPLSAASLSPRSTAELSSPRTIGESTSASSFSSGHPAADIHTLSLLPTLTKAKDALTPTPASSASLGLPEPPLPTPAPSKQPSTASLRIPRTDSPKPIKQASAASLRAPPTPAASKQTSLTSLRHGQAPPSPRPRTQGSSTSLRAPATEHSSLRSFHSARSASPRPSFKALTTQTPPPQAIESITDPSELDCPLTPPDTPPRTLTPRPALSLGARVWHLDHVRRRVVDVLVKDRVREPHAPPVLAHLMCVNRASFCTVVAVLYADVSYTRLPLNLPVPTLRMSVYRAAVHKLDLTGCIVACRGHGFAELFTAFPNLETVMCGKVEMTRPSESAPLDIRVTRCLPMRNDGIFFTIHPFEPCLPRSQEARVSYALEFGPMPRAGALRFAEGQKHATVPPVLCRPIHSLATDESHSARAWLSILARRAREGFALPQRLHLSHAEPVSLGEFAAFAASAAAIEELRLAVDLTNPPISPAEFFETVDWTAFAGLKRLDLALFVPPPPKAEEHFSTRERLVSTATMATISTVAEEPASPAIEAATTPNEPSHEPLSVRERVARPVSGLFKGLGAFAKGFKKDTRQRVDSEPVRRRVDSEPTRRPRPSSEIRRPPSILDPEFGVWPAEPSAAFPAPRVEIPPPELALAELRLTLTVHLPEWAAYDAGGDDWGYIRASVPHPAQLSRGLLRFGAQCGVYVTTKTTTPVDGVDEISADYELRVVGRVADAFGRYGPFESDAARSMYVNS